MAPIPVSSVPVALRGERRTVFPSSQLARIQNAPVSRSSTELRSSGQSNQALFGTVSLSDLLPPTELRGFQAYRIPALERSSSNTESVSVSSQAHSGANVTAAVATSSAALAAAAVLRGPPRCGVPTCSDTDSDGGVSQFTASSCSTIRGYGYAKSDSSKDSNYGLILGRRSKPLKSKRWSASSKRKEDCVCCPRGHELLLSERHKPWFCHGCGRTSSTAQMECFRCTRCNYNLCDHCFSAQESDQPNAVEPLSSKRSDSKTSTFLSAPVSVDEVLARSSSEPKLPAIPPAFSRKLSPSSTASSWHPSISQMSTKSSWRSKSRSKSPQDRTTSGKSSRRSSVSSASSVANPRNGLVDPLLRIVSLSEWLVESGMFADAMKDVSHLSADEKVAAARDLAEIMVRGISYGSAGTPGTRQRSRKGQLQAMSQCRGMPLEDVQEDLKIWHLTLKHRPSRRNLSLLYGRVDKSDTGFNPDADLLARMYAEENGFTPRGSVKSIGLPGLAGSDQFFRGNSGSFGQSGGPLENFGQGSRGSTGRHGSMNGEMNCNDVNFFGDLPGGPSRTSLASDPKFGTSQSGDLSSQHQSDGKRDSYLSSKRTSRKSSEGLESESGETEGYDTFDDTFDDRLRADSAHSLGCAEEKSSSPSRSAVNLSGEHLQEGEAENLEDDKEADKEIDEAEIDAELLASGALFRVKEVVAQVIYEEFASLWPPPPLARPVCESQSPDAGYETESAFFDSTGDAPSPAFRQRRRSSVQHSKMPTVQPTAIPSNLAQDFRKCLEDAFRAIEYPEEAKPIKKQIGTSQSPESTLMEDMQEDPTMQRIMTRSNTSLHFKSDASMLEQHLQYRAEKHSRRLRKQTMVALKGKQDRWPRRLAACQQSLKMTSPLSAFAEMARVRQRVATA